MAFTTPEGFDIGRLRQQVSATYSEVARRPEGTFHFHRGLNYAVEWLGYDRAELSQLPEAATARFAGVGNPLAIGPIQSGETVLDMGCGAGTDLLLAARRVAVHGVAIGVDMTPSMREVAQAAAMRAGLENQVQIREGYLEELPLENASVDVVISNGVFNLAVDKSRVFAEVWRVLRPGGRLYLADVIVQRELKSEARANPDLWAACIGGALTEAELRALTDSVGLRDARIVRRFDCFRGTSGYEKVSKDLFVMGVNFCAFKAD